MNSIFDPEQLAEMTARIERGEYDYLEGVELWWKRSTDLKECFDLVDLNYVAEQLSTGPRPIPYDNVLTQLRLSAQQGGFGFIRPGRKVEKLFYLGPDIAKLLTRQELVQITDDQLIDDERLRLTPLEIETVQIRLMWASRSVLAQWLGKRKWWIPPELVATKPKARVSKPDQPAVTALVLRLAQERGSPVKQSDTDIRAACDALGATKPQRLAAFRGLPKRYRYSKGAPPK